MTHSIGSFPTIQGFGTPPRAPEASGGPMAADNEASYAPSVEGDTVSTPGLGSGASSQLNLDDFARGSSDAAGGPAQPVDDFLAGFENAISGLNDLPGTGRALGQEELQEMVVDKLLGPLPSLPELPKVSSFKEMDFLQRGQLTESIRADAPLQEAFQNWDRLGYAAKMQAGTRISELQANIYGFEAAPLRLEADLVKRPGAFGYYSPESGKISISPYHLDNLPEFVNTIAHEQTHVYQDAVVNSVGRRLDSGTIDESHFMVPVAREWAENNRNYISASKDPQGYRTQPIEAHAWATGDGVMNGVFAK